MRQKQMPSAHKLKIVALGALALWIALGMITGCGRNDYPDYQATHRELVDFRKGASEHLKGKYAHEMIVIGNAQYFGKPFYSFEIKACPANDKSLIFTVSRSNLAELDSPEWAYPGYQDDYPDLLWGRQAKKEFEPIVRRLLSKDARIEVDVYDTSTWDEKRRATVPDYKELRDKKALKAYTDGEVLTNLRIKIPKMVDDASAATESARVFDLISYLNQQKIEIDSFEIIYASGLTIRVGDGRRLSHIINMDRLAECTK